MSAQASVLFDAPGPIARRRILLANLVSLAAVLVVAVLVLIQMNATGQLSGRRWLAAALQYTNCPLTRTGIAVGRVHAQGLIELAEPFELLADAQQQFAAAAFQPGIAERRGRYSRQDLRQRLAGIEALATAMQMQVGVQLGTRTERS